MDKGRYEFLIQKLALKHRKTIPEMKRIIESQFEFIATKTKELNFKELQSEEEFNELKTNFNVKYLFTLFASYNRINKLNKKNALKSTLNKES